MSEDRKLLPPTLSRPTRPASYGLCRQKLCCGEPDEPGFQCSPQEQLAELRAPQTASCLTAASKREFDQSCAQYFIPRQTERCALYANLVPLAIPILAPRDRNRG